ncbi:MAG: hypothetical protein ABIP74_02820 [Candidatus Saccharimonas sp.]
MNVKTRRTHAKALDQDSFGAYFVQMLDDGPQVATANELLEMYPTFDSQVKLCWRMLRSDDFDPLDPWGSLDSEYMWADMAAEERRYEERDAWDQHDYPEGDYFHWGCGHGYNFDDEHELDDFIEETTRMLTPTLDDHIFDAFPVNPWKNSSKKHWAGDRTARNERRDGSPRDKVGRSVDKACNASLRREERRCSRQNLIDIAFGVIDADDVAAPIGSTLPFWDKGTPPETKQA